jgi:PAS domain S-box-containing protein
MPAPDAYAFQRRIGELLDSFGDCFVVFDPDWRILVCNGAAERYFKAQDGGLVGRAFPEIAPDAAPGELSQALTRVMVERCPLQGEAESSAHAGRWLAFRAFPVDDGVGVGFREITEQRDRRRRNREQAEDLAKALGRVEELESRHAFLLQLSDTLRTLDDPERILAAASAMIGERMDACRVGYAQMTPDDRSLVVGGNWTKAGVESYGHQTFPKQAFGAKAIQLLQAGKVVPVEDVFSDARTSDQRRTYDALKVGAFIAVPLLSEGRMVSTFTVMVEGARAWTDDHVRLVEEVAARTWSALQSARAQRALQESEARFRSMADCAPAPVWVTSAAGEVEFVNQAYSSSLAAPPEKLLGHAWLDMIHPEDRPHVIAARAAARKTLDPYTFEARLLHPGGEYRIMLASSRPRFDEHGVFQGYVGMSIDVTAARRAEERQNLLIKELNHRVKNILSTVQSIIHQILRKDAVQADTRRRITERLIALSSAHDVLTRQNWQQADLLEVICEAMQPYTDPQAPRIELAGPPVKLAPSVAVAIAMALNELGTNAVRHGALSAPSGQVRISWRAAEAGALELEWRERGGPLLSGQPNENGFGTRLLQSLVSELGKPAELDFTPTGLVCRLYAPLAKS